MSSVRPETLDVYHERLNRALVFIDQHRSEALSLGQYVQCIRLETAAMQLQTSTRSVLEFALDAGYESAAAFSRAFEQRLGLTPSECCASHRLELRVRAAHLQPHCTAIMIAPEIRQRSLTTVAFVRHIGPYDSVGAAWEKLCAFAGQHQLFGPKTTLIGISRDDPNITTNGQLRYDACITLDHDFNLTGEIGVQTVQGGRYAVSLHCGPYENFSTTYDAIYRDCLPQSGEPLRDAMAFELYLNTPDTTPPADLRTEIWVPLEN